MYYFFIVCIIAVLFVDFSVNFVYFCFVHFIVIFISVLLCLGLSQCQQEQERAKATAQGQWMSMTSGSSVNVKSLDASVVNTSAESAQETTISPSMYEALEPLDSSDARRKNNDFNMSDMFGRCCMIKDCMHMSLK